MGRRNRAAILTAQRWSPHMILICGGKHGHRRYNVAPAIQTAQRLSPQMILICGEAGSVIADIAYREAESRCLVVLSVSGGFLLSIIVFSHGETQKKKSQKAARKMLVNSKMI